MGNTKHTPGPWIAYDDRDTPNRRMEIIAEGKTIAHIYCSVPEQDTYNARLIAAAPALLQALVEIRGWRELRDGQAFPVERVEAIADQAIALANRRARGEAD